MKRIIKCLLCMLVMVMFVSNAKALDITVNNSKHGISDENGYYVTNKGILTVTGVSEGDTFEAFKLIDVYYNSTSNAISYEFTEQTQTLLDQNQFEASVNAVHNLTRGDITSGSTTTASTLDYFASMYSSWLKSSNVSGISMNVNGTVASRELEAGMYLILPRQTNKVYAVMVGNVNFTSENGNWVLRSDTIVAKKSDISISSNISDTLLNSGSFNEGEKFGYNFNVDLPIYPTNATNKTARIIGTIDEGLALDIDTAILRNGSTVIDKDFVGNILDDNNQPIGILFDLIIDDIKVGSAKLLNSGDFEFDLDYDRLESNNINFEVKFSINESAKLGVTGNSVKLLLEYANDPYGPNNTRTTNSIVTINTYKIKLFKQDGNNKGLEGAIYKVYSDSSLEHEVCSITTLDTGYGESIGLANETYYLKEIKAPNGYKINNDVITVIIDTTNGYTDVSVIDSKMGILPSTGGMGTYIFIVFGAVIIVLSIVFLMKKKKEKDKENE